MKYIVLGEELNVEFAEVIYNLDDIEELGVLGEIENKTVLSAFTSHNIYYINEAYGDGVRQSHLISLNDYLVVSCLPFIELFNKCDSILSNTINLRQLNPDTSKVVDIDTYLRKKDTCDHAMVKVLTSRSVYDCLGLNRDDIKSIINSKIDEIDVESSKNDVAYFEFINKSLVPSNRGIVISGNPGYTHMCGLNTESIKCIDRRFLRCEHTNIRRCLINCDTGSEFTLSLTNYSNILIDDELLRPTRSIVEYNILLDGLKAYINSNDIGYIYLNKLTDESIDALCGLGLPVEKIKEWRY